MLLFNVSASAQGRTILSGKKLYYDDVLLALGYIENYTRIMPISINITSLNYTGNHGGAHDYVDMILLNEFINGWRKPHLVQLEEHQLRDTTDNVVYEDWTHDPPYQKPEKGITYD